MRRQAPIQSRIGVLTVFVLLTLLPAAVTIAVVWTATPALAQGTFYVGPHVGIQKESGAEESNHLFGATARLKLLPFLGVEGATSYRQEQQAGDGLTIRTWPVLVSGLLYPLPFLYGGVGAGWYHTTFDYAGNINGMGFDDFTEQEFGWHLAVGAEVPASPWLSLMADVRWVYLDYEFADLPDAVTEEVPADHRLITLGLLFRL